LNTSVEIGIVILIAATMVLVSLLLSLLVRRSRIDDAYLTSGAGWLIAANFALLFGALSVLFIQVLPQKFIICTSMSGAYLGFLCGYFSMQTGLGGRPHFKAFAAISAGSMGLQWLTAFLVTDLGVLLAVAAVCNGAMAFSMGLIVWRTARPFGREIGLLIGAPFFAISAVFCLRLLLLAVGASELVIVTVSALNAFVFAYSALQWSFALIALRAARLNVSLEAARQHAQDLAQTRGRFLAHMSHEIRTPLNSVLGLADVLQGLVRPGEEREIVGHIQNSGDLLIHILNDILDVSKLDANAVKIEDRPFDLAALLHQIEVSHSTKCKERGVALIIDTQPDAVGFWQGDPHRVAQVLHNVVGNSVKFTEQGHVRVTVSGTDQVRVVVEDTGIGMNKAQVDAIFDEFSQADEGITRRFGGTGLGMAIVHRLVKLMNGKISVESEPGKGSRFTIELPLRRTKEIAEFPRIPTQTTPPDLSSLRVLCADDSLGNLRVLSKMLRLMGIKAQTVQDGQAAIRIAELQAFDVYLLDISMPGFSGVETLDILRQIEKDFDRAPAFAVAATANVLPSDVDRYLSLGFDGSLPKPIRLAVLRSVLESCEQTQVGMIDTPIEIEPQKTMAQ
jgi:signal transduction histidine kinase/CheY-like chemotaxis protein